MNQVGLQRSAVQIIPLQSTRIWLLADPHTRPKQKAATTTKKCLPDNRQAYL
jgi:hypothetical protein